jgi:hypothetical protein
LAAPEARAQRRWPPRVLLPRGGSRGREEPSRPCYWLGKLGYMEARVCTRTIVRLLLLLLWKTEGDGRRIYRRKLEACMEMKCMLKSTFILYNKHEEFEPPRSNEIWRDASKQYELVCWCPFYRAKGTKSFRLKRYSNISAFFWG